MLQLAVIIELIAVGPGTAASDSWGECALRVIDRRAGTDQVFGRSSPSSYVDAIGGWSRADRTVTRRVLVVPESGAIGIAERVPSLAGSGGDGGNGDGGGGGGDGLAVEVIAEELDLALGGALRAAASLDSSARRNSLRSRILAPVRSRIWLFVGLDLLLSPRVDELDEDLAWGPPFLCSELTRILDATKLVSEERDAWVSSGSDARAEWSWPWIAVYLLFTAPLLVLVFFGDLYKEPRNRGGGKESERMGWVVAIYGGIVGLLGLGMIAAPWALGSVGLLPSGVTKFVAFGFGAFVLPVTHGLLAWPRFRWARPYLFAHSALLIALLFVPAAKGVAPAIAAVLPVSLALGVSVMRRMP